MKFLHDDIGQELISCFVASDDSKLAYGKQSNVPGGGFFIMF